MSQANVQHFINIINNEKQQLIAALAKEYGFDQEFAYNKFVLNIDTMVVVKESPQSSQQSSPKSSDGEIDDIKTEPHTPCKKNKFVLPWSGIADDSCCQGLRNNYGIFTQCMNPKVSDCRFCKQCVVAIAKNGDEHPCGTVVERLAVGINDYKDPKGKRPVHYTQYMKRMQITKQDVIDLADGKFVDPSHFVYSYSKRGRPPKNNIIVHDSDDDDKKKPGRPKKISSFEPTPADIIHSILHNKLHTNKSNISSLSNLKITIPISPTHN